MDPNQQPQQSEGPTSQAPYNPNIFASPPGYEQPPVSNRPGKKSKLPFIVGGVVVVVLILLLLVVLVLGNKKETPKTQDDTSTHLDSSGDTQPATAVSVGQIDNSISQDLSTLNDDTDFPVNQFDDKELGL